MAPVENHYELYQRFYLLKANKSNLSHFSTPPPTTMFSLSSATNSLTQQRRKVQRVHQAIMNTYQHPLFQLPVGDDRLLMTVNLRKLGFINRLWSVLKILISQILELDPVVYKKFSASEFEAGYELGNSGILILKPQPPLSFKDAT